MLRSTSRVLFRGRKGRLGWADMRVKTRDGVSDLQFPDVGGRNLMSLLSIEVCFADIVS